MAVGRTERVSLLAIEPELEGRIPPEEIPLARRHLTARMIEAPAGEVTLEGPEPGSGAPFAAIVLDGLLLRQVTVMGDEAVQLLGPGDLVPAGGDSDGILLPRAVSLSSAGACRLGGLDGQLLVALRRWPAVAALFIERAGEQIERLAVEHAIGQLPRVQDRILATMWHLAERHGKVTPSGVHLPITLTHRLLGRLVGARRPTVSLALAELESRGALGRRGDRTWMLLQPPAETVAPTALPGDAAQFETRSLPTTTGVVSRRSPDEARDEPTVTIAARMHHGDSEADRRLAERREHYEAIRAMAAGARRRAERTRSRSDGLTAG